MNARCTLIILLLSLFCFLNAREDSLSSDQLYSVKRFSLSVNPMGMLQFGPMIHGEVSLGGNLRLDAHVRFSKLGLGYQVINSPDQMSSIPSPGAGIIQFFGKERHVCPYFGVLAEYDHQVHTRYEPNAGPEITTEYDLFITGLAGGCRFRFSNGFFMGTGAYVFYSIGPYTTTSSWYDDVSEGLFQQKRPRVQFDFRFGYEFGMK